MSPSPERNLQRAEAIRNFARIRWVVILILFFLHAYLEHSFVFGDIGWQRILVILGFYAALNICVLVVLPAERHPASRAGTIWAGIISLGADLILVSFFGLATHTAISSIAFAFFFLPIIEAAAFFSEGGVIFTFFLASAAAGFVFLKQSGLDVAVQNMPPLIPQQFLLVLGALFAWTLRRNVEAHATELTRTKQLTEAVVENLPEGVAILDTDRRVIMLNPGGEALLGLASSDILGLKIRKHMSYPIRNIANLLKIVEIDIDDGKGQAVRIEYPEARALKVIRIPLTDKKGSSAGEMRVFQDVSQEEFLAKLKSDFISIAAHQLRTPLSSIKWAFAMMKEGGLGPLTAEQTQVTDQGLETTGRLVKLVNSLLNVSRMEEGRFGYEIKSGVDVAGIIARVVENLKQKAASREVRLEAEIGTELPPVTADPEKLDLILENIVDNAISYTLAGGRVRIYAAPEGAYLRISVSDTGVGIPQSQQKLLFSKFFRGDNVIRMQTEGSGLGLFIVKNIVEQHGGTITLSSREGEGTTVSFTTPLSR